ncbi:MAG: hypothetical protein Q7S27_00720 [Nanoarchaeota archaeon]|nr:hypothetical protein [Nanoarchaeota archaeon]
MKIEKYMQKNRIFQVKVPLEKGREFEDICKIEDKTVNAKLRELIEISTSEHNKRYFLAGKNKIEYDKTNDKFVWIVELDDGKQIEVLDNLSIDFLNNIKEEISKASIERQNWIGSRKIGSVSMPNSLMGVKKK